VSVLEHEDTRAREAAHDRLSDLFAGRKRVDACQAGDGAGQGNVVIAAKPLLIRGSRREAMTN